MFAHPAWHDDVFAHLDRIDTDPAFDEDSEDVKAYEAWVRSEVERKLARGQASSPPPPPVQDPLELVAATHFRATSSPPLRLSSPPVASRLSGVGPTHPTHPTHSTRQAFDTPARISTAPTVETPTLTAPLPAPPACASRLFDTPISIATPQSPDATHPSAIARGPRDDPATPVPLGMAELERLRKRENFKELTKHLQDIAHLLAPPAPAARGGGRGRGRGRLGMTRTINIGGNVLAGTRICLAPNTLSKPRAAIVSFKLMMR